MLLTIISICLGARQQWQVRENIENKCLENSQKVLSWVAAAENVCFEQHMVDVDFKHMVDVCWKEILGSDHLSKPRQLLHRLRVIMSAKIDWSLSLCDQNFFRERISVVRSFVSLGQDCLADFNDPSSDYSSITWHAVLWHSYKQCK